MLDTIVKEVDVDHSHSINEREFLMVMRRVRELEVEKVLLYLQVKRKDVTMFPCSEVEPLVRAMGSDPDAVTEALAEANLAADDKLDLSGFWQFLTVYRSREGLSTRDSEEIDAAFDLQDPERQGEIST